MARGTYYDDDEPDPREAEIDAYVDRKRQEKKEAAPRKEHHPNRQVGRERFGAS